MTSAAIWPWAFFDLLVRHLWCSIQVYSYVGTTELREAQQENCNSLDLVAAAAEDGALMVENEQPDPEINSIENVRVCAAGSVYRSFVLATRCGR